MSASSPTSRIGVKESVPLKRISVIGEGKRKEIPPINVLIDSNPMNVLR